nr:hypothetical protein [bacterium]
MKRVRRVIRGKNVICHPALTGFLENTYTCGQWVYDRVKQSGNAIYLRGRIPVLAGNLEGMPTVIKRHVHGGLLARLTGDRFLSANRVTGALNASDMLIQNNIATPEYRFVTWERSGIWVRMESGVAYAHDAVDASDFFFGSNRENGFVNFEDMAQSLGRFVYRLHRTGYRHPDL